MEQEYDIFELGDVTLQSGVTLPSARLAYKTYGILNGAKDNVVFIPTCYMGVHRDNEIYFGDGRAIDPANHFIVTINMFGNGLSSSPSNTPAPFDGPRFPDITMHDNVACQYRLLREAFGIERVALVTGWSMGGCQSFQWGAQFPDTVGAILPFCGSARTSPHNFVFLEGVKAALQADTNWKNGDYSAPPEAGLKAFARVYAGWGYSQTFYREALYHELGCDSVEDVLLDWEREPLPWDANNLMTMLWTWQQGDISASETYNRDFERALGAIQARALVMPCSTDLSFTPADNEIEVQHMPNAVLQTYDSPWGHCVADRPDVLRAFDWHVRTLLNSCFRTNYSGLRLL